MKLNLGSGNDYREGWVNVDSGNCRADVKHDLETFPWPFEANTVDAVLMQHVLEHISKENFIPLLRELHRICRVGAIIDISSPHAGSDNFWTDPTHKLPLTVRTFDFFDPSKALHENGVIYGWGDIQLKVLEAVKVDNPPNGPDVRYKLLIEKQKPAELSRPRFTYYTIIGKDPQLLRGHLDNIVNHAGFGLLQCEKELIVIIYRNSKISPHISQELEAICRQWGARPVFYDEPTTTFIDNLYACWNLGYQVAGDGYVFRGGSDQVFSKNSFLSLFSIAEELRKIEPSFPFVMQANTIENVRRAPDSRHLQADFGDSFANLRLQDFEAFCTKISEPVHDVVLPLEKALEAWGKPTEFLSSLGKINRTDGCSWLMTKAAWRQFGPLPVIENGITGDVIIHDRMQQAGFANFIVRDCITYHFVRGESMEQYKQ
jgi:hypothetical protein